MKQLVNTELNDDKCMHEIGKIQCYQEVTSHVKEMEDGTNLEIDQNICSKEAVWELVNKTSKQEVLEIFTIK